MEGFGFDLGSLFGPNWASMGSVMAQNPELVAAEMAAKGVPPPTAPVNYAGGDALGAALEGGPQGVDPNFNPAASPVPIPTPRPQVPGAGAAATPPSTVHEEGAAVDPAAAAAPGSAEASLTNPNMKTLAGALKGVQAPANPALQKLGTPAAPRPGQAVRVGELMQLLGLMGGQGGERKLPPTLGMALGGR